VIASAPRTCVCGCGALLEGRRRDARYAEGRCRVRALRARQAPTPPQPRVEAAVTLSEPPKGLLRPRICVCGGQGYFVEDAARVCLRCGKRKAAL
jgi:hypothetical protein